MYRARNGYAYKPIKRKRGNIMEKKTESQMTLEELTSIITSTQSGTLKLKAELERGIRAAVNAALCRGEWALISALAVAGSEKAAVPLLRQALTACKLATGGATRNVDTSEWERGGAVCWAWAAKTGLSVHLAALKHAQKTWEDAKQTVPSLLDWRPKAAPKALNVQDIARQLKSWSKATCADDRARALVRRLLAEAKAVGLALD